MKHASAYLRNGQVFLNSVSRTTKGFLITCDPLIVSSDPELAKKVLWALSQSTVNVPHPESWGGGLSKAMAKAAGVRSYEAFADLAKCIEIRQDENEVVLTPTRNGGRGKRFLHLKTKIRCQPTDEELTQALRQAFDACEQRISFYRADYEVRFSLFTEWPRLSEPGFRND
jgi:hypothetical protein